MSEELYTFKVIISSERYYNEDSTWGSYIGYTNDDIPYCTKESNCFMDDSKPKSFCNIVGKMQQLSIGCEYQVKARYEFNKKFGHQYQPVSIYALIPQDKDMQILFLKTIISESIAENLMKEYPNVVNDVVNGDLKEIDYKKVKGVGKATWERVKEKIINNFLISDILVMLKPVGVTYTMIRKLLSEEPNPVLLKKQLEENPYILTKINGLGFKRVDELALKMKPKLIDSAERLVAFVKYYFTGSSE